MEGIIKNFRRGRHTVNERQLVIEIEGIDSRKKAFSTVGNSVSWKTPGGKLFTGKVLSAHGNNGAVRALFKKGLPGQCIGQAVEVSKGKKLAVKAAKPAVKKATPAKAVKAPAKKPVAEKKAARAQQAGGGKANSEEITAKAN